MLPYDHYDYYYYYKGVPITERNVHIHTNIVIINDDDGSRVYNSYFFFIFGFFGNNSLGFGARLLKIYSDIFTFIRSRVAV